MMEGVKDPERKEDEVGRIQADIRHPPGGLPKNKSKKKLQNKSKKKLRKKLEDKNKNPYLCTTFRKKPIEKSSLRKLHIQQ